jgi:DNA polymerase-3 subunit epsilon
MNFVAIDFETANERRSSPCALATVSVQEGQIVDKELWLIRPPELYFNPYNTKIHGICEDDVRDKPEFSDLWDTVRFHLEGNIVLAHNATFDMGVLGQTLDAYGIAYPELNFVCTRPDCQTHLAGANELQLGVGRRDAWDFLQAPRCPRRCVGLFCHRNVRV